MSKHDDHVRFHDMLTMARKARVFCEGKTLADLHRDELLAYGVSRCLEIIGEAASKISQSTRSKFPSLPWQEIIGMRNRIVHDYTKIAYDIVWETVQNDLPPLIAELEKISLSQQSPPTIP